MDSHRIPQIRSVKKRDELLHVSMMLPLPADTVWGNLALLYLSLVQRVDHLNQKLVNLYEDFATMHGAPSADALQFKRHALLAEECVNAFSAFFDSWLTVVGSSPRAT